MKLVEFTYTKANGDVSQRAVVEVQAPNTNFEGIDISELPEEVYAEFVQEYRTLKNAQYEQTMEVMRKFDISHNYRKFIPSRMTNVVTEYV